MSIQISACSSTQKLHDLNFPIVDIQKGIMVVLPKGVGKVSPNRRVFNSKYFDPTTIKASRSLEDEEDASRQRGLVEMAIYGDQRPYTVEVIVDIEKDIAGAKDSELIEGEWERVGSDKSLAAYFRDRLDVWLQKQQRDKNLIDDFRAF